MRKKIFLLVLPLSVMLTSCGLFKESCDCPKFGKTNYKATETQVASQEVTGNRQ